MFLICMMAILGLTQSFDMRAAQGEKKVTFALPQKTTPEQGARVSDQRRKIQNAQVRKALYTLGRPYSEEPVARHLSIPKHYNLADSPYFAQPYASDKHGKTSNAL